MKNHLFIIYFFLGAACVSAQNYIDLLKVSANTTPFNTFDSGASRTRVNELVADLTLPIKINNRLSLISGFIYETIQTRLFTDGGVKSFGSATLKLGVNKQFNTRWSGTLVLLPKITSDNIRPGKKDFQAGAIGLMKYTKRTDLNYKFGLYYNSELFGPFFVPMLGLYYLSPDKKLEINLMLPLQADVNYRLHARLYAGLNFNGQIRSYHLAGSTPQHPGTYVTKATNEFYLYLKMNVSGNFSIQAKLGRSVGRSYRVYDEKDKVTLGLPATFIGSGRNQLNSDFSDGLIFQLTLLYRFHLEDKH